MIETQVERYLALKVQDAGGLCFKFTSPGNAGVPDRIVIHEGRVMFVELKRPGETPRELQRFIARKIRANGSFVYCISRKEQVDAFVAELIASPKYPKEYNYDAI